MAALREDGLQQAISSGTCKINTPGHVTQSNDAYWCLDNKGFQLLQKLGYKEGTGLGKKGTGIQSADCSLLPLGSSGMLATFSYGQGVLRP